MGSIVWDQEMAEAYDAVYAAMFDDAVLRPMVDLLAELAGEGPALELAVGTGRVALPLSERGIPVSGIELSSHGRQTASQARSRCRARDRRRHDDHACARDVHAGLPGGEHDHERHHPGRTGVGVRERGGSSSSRRLLRRGTGRSKLQAVPRGEMGRVCILDADHVGIETFDDLVGQIAWSHHWMEVQGRLVRHAAPYRFVWPSELDLMARLAGLRLRGRWADWERSPFTSDSSRQVAVFEKAR